jgi:DNA-binding XRE family transcriptional regulator
MFIPLDSLPGLVPVELYQPTRPGRPSLPTSQKELRAKVGSYLRQLRRQKNLTQTQVANAVGVSSPAGICLMEKGKWFNEDVVGKVVVFLTGDMVL